MDETPLRNGRGFLLALGPPSCRSPFGAQTAPSFVQSFVLRQRPPLSRWPKSLLRKEAPTGGDLRQQRLKTLKTLNSLHTGPVSVSSVCSL